MSLAKGDLMRLSITPPPLPFDLELATAIKYTGDKNGIKVGDTE